jgi:hypothetical protein
MQIREIINNIRAQLDQLESSLSGAGPGPERPPMQRPPMQGGPGGPGSGGMPTGNIKASRLLGM